MKNFLLLAKYNVPIFLTVRLVMLHSGTEVVDHRKKSYGFKSYKIKQVV